MGNLFSRVFDLRRENFRQAFLMFGGLMCAAAAGLSARTMGDTLFLIQYGAEWISYMYIGTALTVTCAALLLRRLGSRFALHRVIIGFSLSLGVISLILRWALVEGPPWLTIPIYLWADVVATLVIVQFWTFTASAFNAREAKRIFAFIGTGGALSGALVGLLIRNYVRVIGTENLLIVGSVLLCGFAIFLYFAAHAGVVGSAPSSKPPRSVKKATRTHAHVRTIAAMVIVSTIAVTMIDYQFKADARAHYPSGGDLASFFGIFYAYNSVASLILQAFFVSRILKKGGLLVSLMILPCSLLLGSGAIVLSSTFDAVVLTKFAHVLLFFTIDNTAFQILYLSIPVQGRGRAKTLIDGIWRPIALGAGGLTLILAIPFVSMHLISIIVLPLILAWSVLVVVNFRGYVASLMASLKQGRFDLSGDAQMSDEASVEVLNRLAERGTDDEVVYMFELIEHMRDVNCTPQALAVLDRDSSRIKILALDYLRKKGHPVAEGAVVGLLDHPDAGVRASATSVVCLGPGSKAIEAVKKLLEDPDTRVRAEAAAGLLRCGQEAGKAWTVMKALVSSENPEERICSAHAIGHAGSAELQESLLLLLNDDVQGVQFAALEASKGIPCPEAIPTIVEMLAEDRTYEAASQALVAQGDGGVEVLRNAAIHDPSGGGSRAALHVPGVLARIGSRSAFSALRELFQSKVDSLRHAAIDATCRIIRERPMLQAEVGDLQELLLAEVGRTIVLQSLRDEMKELDGTDLLVESLEEMRKECLHRVFTLLGVLYPKTDMEAIRRGLLEGSREVRANAVEVLDNTLKGVLRERLFAPLIEPPEPTRVSAKNAKVRLWSLLDWDNDWLRVCALHAIGRGRLKEALTEVRNSLNSPDALVRETGLWTLGQIADQTMFETERRQHLGDPDPRVRGLAAAMG